MRKFWQWISDKKTKTLRKWRSSVNTGPNTNMDDTQGFLADEYSDFHHLRPIGGSESVLSKPKSDQLPRRQNSILKQKSKAQRSASAVGRKEMSALDKVNEEFDDLDAAFPMDESTSSAEAFFDAASPESYANYDDLYGAPFACPDDFNQASTSASLLESSDMVVAEYSRPGSSRSVPTPSPTNSSTALACPMATSMRPSSIDLRFTCGDGGVEPTPPSSSKMKRRLRFKIPQVSLSTADNPTDSTILLNGAEDAIEDTVNTESVTEPMSSECGSVTALAVGLAAAACAANAATNISSISAPVTPHNALAHGKTVDFSGVEEAPEAPPRRAVTDVERRRQSLAQRRQSNVQLVQSVSGRRTSTTLIPLTMAQIHLVRALWRQIYVSKGPTVIGQTIIHRLFFKLPKTKDQFRRCPLPRGFPNHDSFSKAHSKAMAELIDSVVESLDNLEAISEKLERVGRMHAQVLRGELSSKLWNTVAETFIDCTLEWGDKRCRSETVRKAWALIVAFMVERIKGGHLEQRKHMLSMRSTIAALERTELNSSGSMRVNT